MTITTATITTADYSYDYYCLCCWFHRLLCVFVAHEHHIFRSGTDLVSSYCSGDCLQKVPFSVVFKSVEDEIWLIFLFEITSNMAAMMSFHADKCCHMVSENETSALRLCSSVVLVCQVKLDSLSTEPCNSDE